MYNACQFNLYFVIKAPKTVKRKVTELPAVEVCAPGASYNPTLEEHQVSIYPLCQI
jgi:hypothetical protein